MKAGPLSQLERVRRLPHSYRTRLSNLNIRVHIAYGVIGISYTAVALSIILGCQPMSHNWQINPYPGSTSTLFANATQMPRTQPCYTSSFLTNVQK